MTIVKVLVSILESGLELTLKATFMHVLGGYGSGHLGGSERGLGPGFERRRGLYGSSWLQVQGVMVVVSSWAEKPPGPRASAASRGQAAVRSAGDG